MITSEVLAINEKLSNYKAEAEAELTRILAFWEQNALDEMNGGFVGQMYNDGKINEHSPKGGVLNARILWTFSAAYRQTKKEVHRAIADRAYTFVTKHFLDKKHGGTYWSVDAAGKPYSKRKQIYAIAFTVYGLSEYYQATKEAKALQLCQELFHWIEKHSFDPELGGYYEAFSEEGQLLEDLRLSEKDRNDPKTMNTHLHILEAYANLYRIWPDQYLARQLEGILNVFLERIINANTHNMNLFFTTDWKSTANLVSYGHDIEASWLLLEAAEVLGKEELTAKVKDVAVAMAKVTTNGLQPDGSLYHELNKDENHYDKHREWWVSAEAMVGFLNAYQITQDIGYLQHSLNAWNFAKKHLLDEERGEWFWGVFDDYSLMKNEDKIGFWKCPYHNARACLEVMHRCKKLLA
ncbi:AGE family epimerase/isomerase [Pontibacter silvestris]|uniref:Cellobiose 2-epimerase n=1 Tax=Pontibacter silvestris TaxID=2305183 RepID=A0ABW4WWL3_9BACT|nr:AGE family epimerase/isomerase [Pontibacter silvestris]MCC9137603.1 AGE family epimerase/isomerase [Pontibacter silvestris]